MLSPDAIRSVGQDEILIVWSDGCRSLLTLTLLRLQCPCAGCVDELTGERRIKPDQIRPDISILDWKIVGNYAIQWRWSDGHQTGIYSFEYLRTQIEPLSSSKTESRPT